MKSQSTKEQFTLRSGGYFIGEPENIFSRDFFNTKFFTLFANAIRNRVNCFICPTNSENDFTQLSVVLIPDSRDMNNTLVCADETSLHLNENIKHLVEIEKVQYKYFKKDFNCVRYNNGKIKIGNTTYLI